MTSNDRKIALINVSKLKHIEGFSKKRVEWLKDKIVREGIWKVPLKIDSKYSLVMDGQHRMEVAKELNLKFVPCIEYAYDEVEVWSLRKNHIVNSGLIIEKSLNGDIYPYKTAKHSFPDSSETQCNFLLHKLKG